MSDMDQDAGHKAFYQRRDILGEVYEPGQEPRFTDIATFMRTPRVESLDEVDIGIIGIPYDGGLTCRTGARYGPRVKVNAYCESLSPRGSTTSV